MHRRSTKLLQEMQKHFAAQTLQPLFAAAEGRGGGAAAADQPARSQGAAAPPPGVELQLAQRLPADPLGLIARHVVEAAERAADALVSSTSAWPFTTSDSEHQWQNYTRTRRGGLYTVATLRLICRGWRDAIEYNLLTTLLISPNCAPEDAVDDAYAPTPMGLGSYRTNARPLHLPLDFSHRFPAIVQLGLEGIELRALPESVRRRP